ncbi:MAG: class I SAM-dependent methyltransferase [Promethearchaeota archaeon]
MGKLELLATLFRHPLLLLKLVKLSKSAGMYMDALVAEHFREILLPLDAPGKAKSLNQIMEEQGYSNRPLFEELIAILEKNKFITKLNEKIWLSKIIPINIIEQTEKKLAPEVIEAFATFLDATKKAISDRLIEKPIDDFDAGELRIQWNIALRGEFYRLQRRKAFELTKLKTWVTKRKQPLTFLDYGCGSGDGTRQLYEYLNKIGIEFNMEACDVSEGLMEIAEEDETLELPIYYFSLKEKNPPENHYDAIFASQVLHWIQNPTELVANMKSWIKPGGIIFGVQSSESKRLYQIDLFIRLLGAQGFPALDTFRSWFKNNDMTLEYYELFGIFKAEK